MSADFVDRAPVEAGATQAPGRSLRRGAPANQPDAAGRVGLHRALANALSRSSERVFISGAAIALYLLAAAIVVLADHSIIGDAWSRVANGYYVLFSRDPHLAAIGFVWNPLPSIAVLPLLPLKFVWPQLVTTGFAGSIVSALCMGASVWQLHGIAEDWNVRRSRALLVTLLFAFNPMIVYYAANGMSEAMFILTMMVSVRYLARWATDRSIGSLAVAGIAMAAAYLTRYEAAAAAIAAFAGIVLLSVSARGGSMRDRLGEGVADGIVFFVPFANAFVGWAVASWLIVGDPFEQFTSVYGVVSQLNVAQSAVAQTTGQGTLAAYAWVAHQLLGLEPGILIVGLLALWATFRGRQGLTVPAVAVFGGVAAWAIFGFLTGRTLGWLRYSISVIPLVSILALAVLAPEPQGAHGWHLTAVRLRRRLGLARRAPASAATSRVGVRIGQLMGAVAVGFVLVAIPVGWTTMLDPGSNPPQGGEAFQLRPVVFPGEAVGPITPTAQYDVGRQAATYLDALALGRGQVLVDGAMGFPIILESKDPTQFITTSDRDFTEALLDPTSFGVKYLLVPESVGYQSLDAVNRAYPGIYAHGATVAQTLVAEFSSGGNNWRLYKVSS